MSILLVPIISFKLFFTLKLGPDLVCVYERDARTSMEPFALKIELNVPKMKLLNSDITTKIAKQIGLAFVSEQEAEGNVCMANSSEVRLEFKEIFSTIDVFDYIHGVLHSSVNQENKKDNLEIELMKIPLPINLSTFQKYVNLGAEIRQNPLLQTPNTKGNYTEFSLEGEYIVAK